MMRVINIVLTITSFAAFAGVYVLKYSVEETASTRFRLQAQIERQEGELSLLKADWALLNQPGHLEPIVVRHAEALGLQPAKAQQFGAIEALPMRPAAPDPTALQALILSLDAGIDPAEAPMLEQ